MQELLRWALSQGACVNKMTVSADNSREFIAAEDIAPGDALIKVPQEMLMHANCAYEDAEFGEAFRVLGKEGAGEDPRNIICLLLILERSRGAHSKWAPYIELLPKQYEDPFWWSPEEISSIRGTRLGRAVEQHSPGLKRLEAWARRLVEIQRSLKIEESSLSTYQGGWALTRAAVLWGRSTVWSRSFSIHRLAQPANGQQQQQQQQKGGQQPVAEPVIAMVPVLDMIDHNPQVEAVWHTGPEGKDDFTWTPLSGFKRGEPLRNNYGCKTNDELILAYGFVIPDNPADYFQVSIGHGLTGSWGQEILDAGDASALPAAPYAAEVQSPVIRSESMGRSVTAGPCSQKERGVMTDAGGSVVNKQGGMGASGMEGTEPASCTASAVAATTMAAQQQHDLSGASHAQKMQQQAEEMQRQKILTLLDLPLQHRLTLQQPLPQALVLSTQACLLPPAELHLISSTLLVDPVKHNCGPEQQQQQQSAPKVEPSLSSLPSPHGMADQGFHESGHHKSHQPSPRCLPRSQDSPAELALRPEDRSPSTMLGKRKHVGGETAEPHTQTSVGGSGSELGGQACSLEAADRVGCSKGTWNQSSTGSVQVQAPKGTFLLPATAIHVLPESREPSIVTSPPPLLGASGNKDPCILLGCGSNLNKKLFGLNNCLLCGEGRLGGLRLRLPHDLRVLVALQQQLEMKLEGIATELELAQLVATSSTKGEDGGDVEMKFGTSTTEETARARHGHLLSTYVNGQRAILKTSLAVLQKTISKVLHEAASMALSDSTEPCMLQLSSAVSADGPSAPPSASRPLSSFHHKLLSAELPAREHSLRSLLEYVYPPLEMRDPLALSSAPVRGPALAPGLASDTEEKSASGAPAPSSDTDAGAKSESINDPMPTFVGPTTHKNSSSNNKLATTDIVSHMQAYCDWLSSHGVLLPHQDRVRSSSQSPAVAVSATETFPCRLTEVLTQLRPSALTSTSSGRSGKIARVASFRAQQRSASAVALHAELARLPSKARAVLPLGISCSFGLPFLGQQEYDPVSWGAHVTAAAPAGSLLLKVPSECTLMSTSKEGLVQKLLVPAYRLLQSLIANITRAAGIPPDVVASMMNGARKKDRHGDCKPTSKSAAQPWSQELCEGMQAPADMLVLHLLHTVGASAPARLAVSESDGMRMVFEMLEDSPSGATYEEVFSTMEDGFNMLKARLAQELASMAAQETAGSALQDGMVEEQQPSAAEILGSLSWSGGFGLYCWAVHAVDRSTVRIHQRGGAAPLWALVPLVCAVPPELKDAVLRVSYEESSCSCDGKGLAVGGSGQTEVLAVHAACHLSGGLPLTPSVLLRWMDCDSLLASYGPEALAWHRLMSLTLPSDGVSPRSSPAVADISLPPFPATQAVQQESENSQPRAGHVPTGVSAEAPSFPQASAPSAAAEPSAPKEATQAPLRKRRVAPAATSRQLHVQPVGAKPAEAISATPGSVAAGAVSTLPAAAAPVAPQSAPVQTDIGGIDTASPTPGLMLYELYIAPAESDELYIKKMELLTAAGLGTVHYLTEGLETRASIVSALRICLADAKLLMDPSVLALIQLHAADNASLGANKEAPVAQEIAEPGAAANPGSPGAPGLRDGTGNRQMQKIHAAQLRLVGFLTALPDDHPVAQAARRQLRHLISDACKYAKRRLRQMDSMQLANAKGTSVCSGVTPAIRIGVRCYLQAIAHVLEIWSEYLGLNQSKHSGASSGLLASSVPSATLGMTGGEMSCDLIKKRNKLLNGNAV